MGNQSIAHLIFRAGAKYLGSSASLTSLIPHPFAGGGRV